jgi:predicted phage terminase large subunit-like protein
MILSNETLAESYLGTDMLRAGVVRELCNKSFLHFARFMFMVRESSRFIVSAHHRLLCDVLTQVMQGDIARLIINVPPGYTKTELAVVAFIAYGLARYPRSKFLHISYSDDLALENSAKVRDVVNSIEYQALWPMTLRTDSTAKKRWYTEQGGGLMAVSSGGQITGFRAGRMEQGFSGAIVIDDPLKPEDAYSDVVRNRINNRLTNTIRSRLATEDVPIILIMQRLHEDDPTGYLLRGGTGEHWHHLELGTPIDPSRMYPKDFTHSIPIIPDLPPGPLWAAKHNLTQIAQLKADPYTYASQYLQRPAPLGGGIFHTSWFHYYKSYDAKLNRLYTEDGREINLRSKNIFADTAQKTGQHNDYSVFQAWGQGTDGKIYLLDQMRGKWEAPELRVNFLAFCARHEFRPRVNMIGVRGRYIEDKVSGTGLIQDIQREKGMGWVRGIPRDRDKVSRAMGCTPQIAQGNVVLPRRAAWIDDYIYEFAQFTPLMTHRHDDQIDPTLDAIEQILISRSSLSYRDII